MKVYQSKSLEETQKIAHEWVGQVQGERNKGNMDQAYIVGLSGHLGAGKTAFTKAVAKTLGVQEEITSPTFVIMKIYPIPNGPFKRLVHIDAYRLEQAQELEALQFENVVSDPGNLVVIEWPENVELKKEDVDQYLKFEIKDGAYTIQY